MITREPAESFKDSTTATGQYNLGNALAKSGRLQEALAAYEQALKIAPALADAKANRQLVEKILAEQEKQKRQQEKNGKAGENDKQPNRKQEGTSAQQDDKNAQTQNDPDKKGARNPLRRQRTPIQPQTSTKRTSSLLPPPTGTMMPNNLSRKPNRQRRPRQRRKRKQNNDRQWLPTIKSR